MEILFNQLEALSSLQGRLPSVVRCYEINLKGRVTVLFDAHKKKKFIRIVFQMTHTERQKFYGVLRMPFSNFTLTLHYHASNGMQKYCV